MKRNESRICYKCKQESLEYDPEGHEQYPYICRTCGIRWGAEIPWWKDTLQEIAWIVLWVAIGIGGLFWIVLNPWHTWWSFIPGAVAIAYATSRLITRTHICF